MKTKFNVGDVVQLKSGGPNMAIERLHGEVTANCVWFGESNIPSNARFGMATLRLIIPVNRESHTSTDPEECPF